MIGWLNSVVIQRKRKTIEDGGEDASLLCVSWDTLPEELATGVRN